MYLFRNDHKLSEIIFRAPAAITVLNRFGINLGVGTQTVAQACTMHSIQPTFLLAILNTTLNEEYFPENALLSCSPTMLSEYLLKTDRYYIEIQLPNIQRHLHLLTQHSHNATGNLELLQTYYTDLSDRITQLARRELNDGQCNSDTWHPVEECISDLLSFFVIHLKGDYNTNLCLAVVTALFTLEQDLRSTTRIRERILRPLLQKTL